jgi:hypothetical protein
VQNSIIKLGDVERSIKAADLAIDNTNQEIYIRGQRLSSKEIKSATTTGEILSLLINSPDLALPNSALPISSYSSDKNELQSKIITPLNQILEKNLKRRLEFEFRGGITKFTLTLRPSTLKVLILDKFV